MKMVKPVLIYDGKCGFCKIWIDYWRRLTGDRVEYAPSQDAGDRYPQIARESFSKAVQLVRPDGSVVNGAEAVFETLECEWAYRPLAPVWEWAYRMIAGHRDGAYFITKWTFGTQIEPLRFARTEWIFVRLLAVIYAIAFGSLAVQVTGLIGSHGILPAADYLKAVTEGAGGMRFFYLPTIFWMNASDAALTGVCYAGVAVAAIVFAGFVERTGLALLCAFYLSLNAVGQDFLSFQWDSLLIEVGFLAIFLGNSKLVVWLFRWLLFRLMFLSGSVKLLSHDPAWRDLTALSYHYWTQPLPTVFAWYMAQAPLWFLKASTAFTFFVELAVPFFIFAPRRIRMVAAWLLIALQALIFLTGNYTFFNLLAIALCTFLFDDRSFWPKTNSRTQLPKKLIAAVAILIVTLGLARMLETFSGSVIEPLASVVKYTGQFEIVNSYGLFAMMTKSRPEIVVEGSMDGETWMAYSFRYKPGDLSRAPRWVQPHQPRLDWQMWFAALGEYRGNPWFVNFAVKLLEGSPEVRGLLANDPFQGRAPRFVRAMLYEYRFTDAQERRETGNWWKRELRGPYLPPVGLKTTSGVRFF